MTISDYFSGVTPAKTAAKVSEFIAKQNPPKLGKKNATGKMEYLLHEVAQDFLLRKEKIGIYFCNNTEIIFLDCERFSEKELSGIPTRETGVPCIVVLKTATVKKFPLPVNIAEKNADMFATAD